jgi:endogenous inhibitor of DNA gyrase (YacG/DUF329 family)
MAAKCAICAKPVQDAFKPFCSRRCADVDLHGWLKGGYAIPGPPVTTGNPPENEPDED